MHQVIEQGLEDFLAGTMRDQDRTLIETHLAECSDCREQVDGMREMSRLFGALREAEAPAPPPGFYARLSSRIETRNRGSIWTAFLQPAFGRRLAFSSLLLLATLGSVLMSRESEYAAAPSPEMILAVDQEEFGARDQMLVTLVRHEQ